MGLDEFALCIARQDLPKSWLGTYVSLPVENQSLELFFSSTICKFGCRREIEDDSSLKQIIPYVLVYNSKGELLAYQRHGTEQRLHQLWSVGVGGHVNQDDCTPTMLPMECIQCGMRRECLEELGIVCDKFNLLGIINEEETAVGHTHIGIVFATHLTADFIPSSTELGTIKFISPNDVVNIKTELWSQLAIMLLKSYLIKK